MYIQWHLSHVILFFTINCCTGIGSGSAPLAQCVELASRPGHAQQWRTCKHLIIDEISMVESSYFDKLEAVARAVRKKDCPFGGVQLILSGDFLQLPQWQNTWKRKSSVSR